MAGQLLSPLSNGELKIGLGPYTLMHMVYMYMQMYVYLVPSAITYMCMESVEMLEPSLFRGVGFPSSPHTLPGWCHGRQDASITNQNRPSSAQFASQQTWSSGNKSLQEKNRVNFYTVCAYPIIYIYIVGSFNGFNIRGVCGKLKIWKTFQVKQASLYTCIIIMYMHILACLRISSLLIFFCRFLSPSPHLLFVPDISAPISTNNTRERVSCPQLVYRPHLNIPLPHYHTTRSV